MKILKYFIVAFFGFVVVSLGWNYFFVTETLETEPFVTYVEGQTELPIEIKEVVKPTLSKKNQEPPEYDRIDQLFNLVEPKLPIVETISYSSKIPWKKGKSAWLVDYASYYKTSRHFIARSLNQSPAYEKQKIREGDKINILRLDIPFEFYLVLDASRKKMWLYYHDLDQDIYEPIKTYQVTVGRKDPSKPTGLLTPFGIYSLGDKVVTYKPKQMGIYQGKNTEMIRVFGTRWIPFDQEIKGCTAPAKSFGIHGVPWVEEGQMLVEDLSALGECASDGCIRLSTEDIEELYAVIISRPTIIEIVDDFYQASIHQGES